MQIRSLIRVFAAPILGCAFLMASLPARAGTIDFTYTFTGTTTITGMTATTISLSGVNTGSFDSGYAAVDAVWNPMSFRYSSQADIATGLLAGNFTMTLANGEMLSGIVNENLSAIISSPTHLGPFPQRLTFTGGTGEFAGVSGTATGTGYAGLSGGSVSGSGELSAPGFVTPEPASIELMLGGVSFLAMGYRRRQS